MAVIPSGLRTTEKPGLSAVETLMEAASNAGWAWSSPAAVSRNRQARCAMDIHFNNHFVGSIGEISWPIPQLDALTRGLERAPGEPSRPGDKIARRVGQDVSLRASRPSARTRAAVSLRYRRFGHRCFSASPFMSQHSRWPEARQHAARVDRIEHQLRGSVVPASRLRCRGERWAVEIRPLPTIDFSRPARSSSSPRPLSARRASGIIAGP